MKTPDWLLKLLPTRIITRRTNNQVEPNALAHTLDADMLQGILHESEGGNMERLFALYRDVLTGHAHTQAEFSKRLLEVIGDPASWKPKNEKDTYQVALSAELERQCCGRPEWLDALIWLLGSTMLPLRIVEKTFRPCDRDGVRWELAALTPVPDRLIDYTDGVLKIWDTDERGNKLGTRHEVDPMRYIVHRGHTLVGYPDTWGGPMRAVLFWHLFAVMDRSWWARFLDRFGSPFMEASYDDADDNARYTLERAFSAATKLFGIAVPNGVVLKMHQASTQGADAFSVFHRTANEEISKAILGQTMSATAANTGLNSSQGDSQEKVRQGFRAFDAARLAATLRTQLFMPLCHLNGWTAVPPEISWGGESEEDLNATANFLGALPTAGLDLTDEGVEIISKRSGIPVQRLAAPQPVGGPALASPLSAFDPLRSSNEMRARRLRRANDEIAENGAEAFALAMSETMAPIRKILADSTSLDDFERQLRDKFPALPSRQAASILSAAMISNAANAVLEFPTPSK
ncbi:MAG: DUF935 family protein [Luteolibacter sp.]